MALISPIKLNLAKKLKENKEFRKRFLRARAQDEIASSIVALREKREMRQVDLAKKSGMKQSAISRIEQADYSGWSFITLLRVAESLNARLRVIFEPMEDVIATYEWRERQAEISPALIATFQVSTEQTGSSINNPFKQTEKNGIQRAIKQSSTRYQNPIPGYSQL
jgi:transcriptional regulator with XRE-family HTH domain